MHTARKKYYASYDTIISLENLLLAWREFQRGKKKKKDVQTFEYRLMENLIDLHEDLKNHTYTHGGYQAFKVNDPKPRDIHKASVRDRVLHHALYQRLSPFFFSLFIADSYSCQDNKGTHKALWRFTAFVRKVSKNHTKQCFVLKCDIKKFFASIDHRVLMRILEERIVDARILWLLKRVIKSFPKGLPLGNLTSQLLVNIYMHEFDQFIKTVLKIKYYIRYADDFLVFSGEKEYLEKLLPTIENFLLTRLRLVLHPDKVFIQTLGRGVDFLGWVHFPYHRVVRTSSKKRLFRRLNDKNKESYLGMLKHGNGFGLQQKIRTFLTESDENV